MATKKFITIAIDGGAASGKSTTSRLLAGRMNLLHVDTGAHYRAITHSLCLQEVCNEDEVEVAAALANSRLGYHLDGRRARVTINGVILEDEVLRSDQVNERVSHYAALPVVRDFIREYQRCFVNVARDKGFGGLVMEGRDIGSVILPDADFKFFLEADVETRAQRRTAEGQKDQVHVRDKIDSQRKSSPMRCAEDALRIDTSALGIEDVQDVIMKHLKEGC